MRTIVFQVAALLLAALAAGASPGGQAPDGHRACAPAVAAQLRAWRVVGPPRPQPSSGPALVRHWPTAQLGEWVVEAHDGSGARLQRVTPAAVFTRIWPGTCVATSEEHARPAVSGPRFTDADLAALVATGRSGVVYVWSPHMPLSVDGYRHLAAAAAARGLAVHATLEPGADRAFARTSLARGGLPADALRVADSVELWFRDVHLHAPSILVFAQGRIAGDAWPGYHSADEYGAFLDRALADLR